MTRAKLIVSLHDVTPAHADRLARAEQYFTASGMTQVTYLLVPDFHGVAAAHASRTFVEWCRRRRPFNVQWFLHGYFHSEAHGEARPDVWLGLAAKLLTAKEAEFAALRGEALRDRLHEGVVAFERCLGSPPVGFVAPGWLFNSELIPVLRAMRFTFTESHFRIVHLKTGNSRRVPVMTWATRSLVRKYGSIGIASLQRRIWLRTPVVRIALHPCDFDHPQTLASIDRALNALRRDREVVAYDDSLFQEWSGDAITDAVL
jgi:hypothetical protein